MRGTAAWIGWSLCLCASLATSTRDFSENDRVIPHRIREDGVKPAAEILRSNKASWRISDHHLVVLRQGTHGSHLRRTIRRLEAKAARSGSILEILRTFSGALMGFLVKMSSDMLDVAVKLPHVHYIEEDSFIFAQSAPWNLQKLLRPHGITSENGTYRPPNDGGMAVVYLMDGSVQTSHREVDGRVFVTDFNSVPEEDGTRAHRQASLCDGHGTHVAGVVSGSDSGIARGAGVNLVRVLNCQGRGTVSGALAGLEYIRAFLKSRPADAVIVLLPFIGAFSQSLNTACRDMVAQGAVVVAAAGNYRDDACLYSPASEPEVITVGAVNLSDQLMSQAAGGTNFGRCVDLFASGDDIVSASSDCNTCFTSRSGTSQAAAHVAGLAAVILSSNQNTSPLQVLHLLLHYSTSNTINLLSLSETHRLTTPNLVAAMPSISKVATAELLCRSVWSERLGGSNIDKATCRCRASEEMMGCSSFAPDHVGRGETVTVDGGQMECVAYKGAGDRGVYAVARCCVMAGLQCKVHPSPQSGRDAECTSQQHQLSGCTSRSTAEKLFDSDPHHGGRKRCVVREGVTSDAVCCQVPSLECKSLHRADKEQVEIFCPVNWTLTDCSAIPQGSAILRPVAIGNHCHVHRVTGPDVVSGMAVCCRVRPSKQSLTTPA